MALQTKLITQPEVEAFLRETAGAEAGVVERLIDGVAALFEAEANRAGIPFAEVETDRVEVHSGTGRPILYLQYPIASISTITLGRDVANPLASIDPDDVDELVFGVGERKIERTGGFEPLDVRFSRADFGPRGSPRFVHVTYTTTDDTPKSTDARLRQLADAAGLAVTRGVAAIFRQRGSEGLKSKRLQDSSAQFLKLFEEVPEWALGVGLNRRYSHL